MDPRYQDHSLPSSPPGYSSASSSPPSSSASPRSSRHVSLPDTTALGLYGHAALPAAQSSSSNGEDLDRDAGFTSSNSESYDSAGESNGRAVQYLRFSGDEGSYSSSSRANSPAPPEQWERFNAESLSYRVTPRSRSRVPSGTTTPTNGGDKEVYGPDYFQSHHHQTSSLLRKLGGSHPPHNTPQKKRRAGWWHGRAESRRNSISSASHSPLLPSSNKSRKRSCLATLGSSLLRQPWVPTQPLTILFSFLLLGCFAATLTTFLVHVLSNDKQPVPWRTYCQDQRQFPHDLADSLAPVNVFVGVFSVDAAYERRQLIRSTYARHSKPIDPTTGRPGQNVQVKFILGRPRTHYARRIALEMEMYNDVVVLDIKENMNKGKTHKYFQWAAENATIPVNYRVASADGRTSAEVGVGFRKADYVVKADDDSFLVLSELERHLRISPRQKTYWGYLVRNLFMAGEIYALSADLVQYVATYDPLLPYVIGAEDKRVAKWMRMHPEVSTINWVAERCWIYDHPKAGTTYSHGLLFPDEVDRIRMEGRRGLAEDERLARGGDLSSSYSTVNTWKSKYVAPKEAMTIEEEVEALVEGGGRWTGEGWKVDGGRGVQAVKQEALIFEHDDERLRDHHVTLNNRAPALGATGVIPGTPDASITLPTARTTRFGKDLFRDPADVDAVRVAKRNLDEEEPEYEGVYNRVTPSPMDEGEKGDDEATWTSIPQPDSGSTFDAPSSAAIETMQSDTAPLEPTPTDTTPSPSSDEELPINTPTGQIRFPAHHYILPSTSQKFLPPSALRYDASTIALRNRRLLSKSHGGTVAVHFLKRNEWFMEVSLALLGREKTWDSGVDAPAFAPSVAGFAVVDMEDSNVQVARLPVWEGIGSVESVDPYWGSARMYGSPIVRDNGYVAEGREVDRRREVILNTGASSTSSRLGNLRSTPRLALALAAGEEAIVGGASVVEVTDSTPPTTPLVES